MLSDAELLALHRGLVAIPSVSGEERALSDHLQGWLGQRGVLVRRTGDSLWATCGEGAPRLCLNSHLDTVPASPGWTRPPWTVSVEEGRVHGLGSNDAKASLAAMIAAFLRLAVRPDPPPLLLALAAGEETGGQGTMALLEAWAAAGLRPEAVVVGEPTELEVAVAQKGLLVLELHETGTVCHAAHGRALQATNALQALAEDLVALRTVDLGPDSPLLGPVTLEPTLARGGTARNMLPAEASCVLDVRVNPDEPSAALLARLRQAVRGELRLLSDRLRPCAIETSHPLVRAATRARPEARLFGSRGLSDLVFFAAAGIAGIKAGPGASERSHTADEYVGVDELLAGARFYEALALQL